MFHSGHVNFLKQCKRIAGANGKVVVSLNTDEFIGVYKDLEPVCNYEERRACLESCRYVDLVVENVGGSDNNNIVLAYVPYKQDISTSIIKKRVYKHFSYKDI